MRNNHILSFLSVSKSMRLSVLFVCLWVFSSAFAESPTPMPTPTPTPHPMPTLGPTPLPNRTASGFDITRCTKCHNESPGRIFRQFPRLAGQKVNYFISSMKAYEDGHRTSPDAKRLMTKRFDKWKLNETTTKELAEYFFKLPPSKGIPGDPQLIARGKEIYLKGIPERQIDACYYCHGKKGEGKDKGNNPRLASQHLSSFMRQMYAHQDGQILGAKEMSDLARPFTKDELIALGTFLQSLD